jgi:SAM-dependent methyltransferase
MVIVFVAVLFFWCIVVRAVRHFWHFPAPSWTISVIDNPVRRRFFQRPEVLAERMSLAPGMTVVEIGPGKGTYTVAMARRVLPKGKVYAVDIQESVIEGLKTRIVRERTRNIFPRIADAYHLSFQNESVDRVVAITCLPEIPEPVRVLRECRRILKPDGLICLSELVLDPDYPRRRTEKGWAKAAGLELRQEFGSWFTYQLNFGRPDSTRTIGKKRARHRLGNSRFTRI